MGRGSFGIEKGMMVMGEGKGGVRVVLRDE